MDLLQKQANNRRLFLIQRQYVFKQWYQKIFFSVSFLFSSEERTKAIEHILCQRTQITQLNTEKQEVIIYISILARHLIVF